MDRYGTTFAPDNSWMHPTTSPWLKHWMLACMIMLGFQLCFPLTLQASVVAQQQVDVISLGIKDPSGKPGLDIDLDVPALLVVALVVPEWSETLSSEAPVTDVLVIPTLLAVAGYHPSAP